MEDRKLCYTSPAESWYEALPLGSGSLGAMVFGGIQKERIGLNLDTLWSGDGRRDKYSPKPTDLALLRRYILEGAYTKAEDYVKDHMLGDWTECYLPAGDLLIERADALQEAVPDYRRSLNLDTAVYEESYTLAGVRLVKEVWTCLNRNVLVVALGTPDREGELNLDISIHSQLQYRHVPGRSVGEMEIMLQAPIYAAPNYYEVAEPIRYEENAGMKASLAVKVLQTGGKLDHERGKIQVRKAGKVYILLTGETDFQTQGSLSDHVWDRLNAFIAEDEDLSTQYEKRKMDHIRRYQTYFHRMDLRIGVNKGGDCEALRKYERMFHYARYLMISSSQPGSECANLQGIWNEHLRAPWSSNYTVNINTQMNYWFVEAANLTECHLPLFDLIDRALVKGRECARHVYGLDGFVTHHNMDIWGHASPVGYGASDPTPSQYSVWPMSSGWLCRHLWEHYLYTNDLEFLEKRAYPVILEAVRFYLGYLVEIDGVLHTLPSTSPENEFINPELANKATEPENKATEHENMALEREAEMNFLPTASMTMSSAMDISILRDLFGIYQKICEILAREPIRDMEEVVAKLPPLQIGKYGQIQEWLWDFEEADIHHRHVSHLYGLYPGNEIGSSEKLCRASRITLERRGMEGTGWCIAWKACLYARLSEGDKALELLDQQLRPTREEAIKVVGGGTYPNLFCAHPPFQIDGNFGFAAAVLEMILQSGDHWIKLLPALPKAWECGSVRGLKARGGHVISFSWEDHRITSWEIIAGRSGMVRLEYNGDGYECYLEKGEVKKPEATDF